VSETKVVEFPRAQSVKASHCDTAVMEFYDSIQTDYRTFLPKLHTWLGIGYGVLDPVTEEIEYVHPEESARLRKAAAPGGEDEVVAYMKMLLDGGTDASSGYNIFYTDYASNGAKLGQKIQFILSIKDLNDKELKEKLKNKQFSQLSFEEWREIGEQAQTEEDVKRLWVSLKSRLTMPQRTIGTQVRRFLNASCAQPSQAGYCRSLWTMLSRQLRSLHGKYEEHLTVTATIREKGENLKNEFFPVICELAAELETKNYGLTKRVLRQAVKEILTPPKKPSNVQVIVDTLKQEKYKALVETTPVLRMKALAAWKIQEQLRRRKVYPLYPRIDRDYKIPIGQGGLIGFSIESRGREIIVNVNGIGNIVCKPSNYFHDLKFTPLLNSQKTLIGYTMEFRHKYAGRKAPSTYSPVVHGVVKEIGLQKRDGEMFVTFPFMVPHDDTNFQIARFFATAEPDLKKFNLPDEFVAAGIDLNISNPICIAKARVGRKLNGPLEALDYGRGALISEPYVAAPDTSRCRKLMDLRNEAVAIRDAIREIKGSQATGTPISEETWNWLLETKRRSELPRHLIENKIAKLSKSLSKLHHTLRSEGYKNIAEMIRLLDAKDKYASLIDSYERIHLKPGETLPKQRKFDTRRANFRTHVLRRIAAAIVTACKDCNVVFVEDLQSNFDVDNDNNSLMRLFSPNTMLKHIKLALEKAGIGFVEAAKDGTSKTDPVTGSVGSRCEFDKQKLFVERNGQVGWIDSDLAACLNVLIRGLGHSVCPYKMYLREEVKVDENSPKVEKELGVRQQRFLKLRYGTVKIKYVLDPDGTIRAVKKLTKTDVPISKEFVYVHGPVMRLQTVQRAEEERIKQLAKANGKAPQFGLKSLGEQHFNNFVAVRGT